MKCFVCVVEELHRKERHSKEELGFSLHGELSFSFIAYVETKDQTIGNGD